MAELAEVIRELRRELDAAIATGGNEWLKFELGPIELELTVGVDSKAGAGAKVRFWVVEMGGDGELARSSTQRIKLTLQPRIGASDVTPRVSGTQVPGER